MKQEKFPKHLKIPEIIRDPQNPPKLLDLFLNSNSLITLMKSMSKEQKGFSGLRVIQRKACLKRVVIRGGLLEVFPENHAPINHQLHEINVDTPEGIKSLFGKAFSSDASFSTGAYDANSEQIFFYPDTIIVVNTAITASTQEDTYIQSASQESAIDEIKNRLPQTISKTLIEELEHSFQKETKLRDLVSRSTPPLLIQIALDAWAREKVNNPQLQLQAQQTIQLKPLISDDQLLDLFLIAQEEYHKIQGDFNNSY